MKQILHLENGDDERGDPKRSRNVIIRTPEAGCIGSRH